jgi:hypothetical protein
LKPETLSVISLDFCGEHLLKIPANARRFLTAELIR